MDFSIPAELAADAKRIEDFVADEIIPLETDPAHYDAYGNIDLALLQRLRGKVKAAGLWAPQIPRAQGGLGYGPTGMAVLYEAMNQSIFGPKPRISTFRCPKEHRTRQSLLIHQDFCEIFACF